MSESREVKGLWLEAVLTDEANPYEVADLLSEASASSISILDERGIGGRLRVRFVVSSEERLPDIAGLKAVRWMEDLA